jgi:hypothetical protein
MALKKEINYVCFSQDTVGVVKPGRMMRAECGVGGGVWEGSAYTRLMRKPEGKRQLERIGCRWKGNTEMNLKEIASGSWNGLIFLRIGKSSYIACLFFIS